MSPTLVFAKYDLVGLSGEVRAIVTNRFTDLEIFPYELLCDDKVFNEARAVSSFNALVSRGLGIMPPLKWVIGLFLPMVSNRQARSF